MEIKALEKLIKGRRSVRKWKQQTVPDELLKKAVELATWAPNGGNYQGWRFIVVKNRTVIDQMADAVQAVSDKIASWPEGAPWKEEMERARKKSSFFRNAPVCMGVFIRKYISAADKVLTAREPIDQRPHRSSLTGDLRRQPFRALLPQSRRCCWSFIRPVWELCGSRRLS